MTPDQEVRDVKVHLAAAAYVRAIRRCEALGFEVVDWANEGEKITEIEIKEGGDRRRLFIF